VIDTAIEATMTAQANQAQGPIEEEQQLLMHNLGSLQSTPVKELITARLLSCYTHINLSLQAN
jgi:CBS domain containing-hemolysin-like protein